MKEIAVKDTFVDFCRIELANYNIKPKNAEEHTECLAFYGKNEGSRQKEIARIFNTWMNLYDRNWLEFFEKVVEKYEKYNDSEITIYYWEHYKPLE